MPGDMVVVSVERLAALERVAKKAAEYRQLVLTLLAKKKNMDFSDAVITAAQGQELDQALEALDGTEKHPQKHLTAEDVYVLWAAMWAAVEDIHSPMYNLTDEQWDRAEELLKELDRYVNSDEFDEELAEISEGGVEMNVGDMVTWTSQAMGIWKEKRGQIIAIVPAGESIEKVWPQAKEIPKARRKWADDISKNDRAIVEVPRASGRGCDYYAPRLAMLKRI